ncbi:MAG TPA: dTDP-4-dehydrorhamnose reductase [Chitinophagales bacterium]|nr:dTDP-4-dehydrorhamnose reductase [Chitinophagales bacterium]
MNPPKHILITGATGQVGSELQVLLRQNYPQTTAFCVGRTTLDLLQMEAIEAYLTQHRIAAIINCAAYTQVDKAETDAEQAYLANVVAVENLARVANNHQIPFLHFSTDFVFDGNKNTPYEPTDTATPLGVYARTKYEGEQKALQHYPNTIILRTAWVYSSFGHNFVKTMLRLFAERPQINVVYDQIGCPTYAADIAATALAIIHSPKAMQGGIHHFVSKGVASWYDFAMAINELSGSTCHIEPILTHQYPTPARRPPYSVLSTQTLQQEWDIQPPYWREALERCLKTMGSLKE